MIYSLLLILILLLIISYYIFDREILSPSVILCAVYIFSVICAIYNIEYWGLKLHNNTFFVIVIGIVCFIIFSYFTKKVFFKYKLDEKEIKKEIKNKIIDVQNIKIIILIILMMGFAVIYAYYVRKIANSYGYAKDYTDLMAQYRMNVSYGEGSLPGWVNQFNKLMKSVAWIFIYIFVNNVIVSKRIVKNIKYVLPTLIYLTSTLFGAQRIVLLEFLIGILTISYLLMIKYNVKISKVNKKYIKKGAVAVVVFLTLFSALRGMVGRKNQSGALEYITAYAGGSIELLDLFLQEPTVAQEWGEETFMALKNTLYKIGITKSGITSPHLEFRYSKTGILVGNVYTAFRKYIHDFGYLGVFVFQMIQAVFYTIFYYKTKEYNGKNNFEFKILYYAYLVMPLFMHSIQETLFSNYFTLNTIIIMILMWCWYMVLVKYKFVYNGKEL